MINAAKHLQQFALKMFDHILHLLSEAFAVLVQSSPPTYKQNVLSKVQFRSFLQMLSFDGINPNDEEWFIRTWLSIVSRHHDMEYVSLDLFLDWFTDFMCRNNCRAFFPTGETSIKSAASNGSKAITDIIERLQACDALVSLRKKELFHRTFSSFGSSTTMMIGTTQLHDVMKTLGWTCIELAVKNSLMSIGYKESSALTKIQFLECLDFSWCRNIRHIISYTSSLEIEG